MHRCFLVATCCFLLPATQSWSQSEDPHAARHAAAIQGASESVERSGAATQASDYIRLGDAQLRGGQSAAAVKSFEAALALQPSSEPYLWQYGIALYFVDRYKDGRILFEKHRVVNPHDVENAAWHFLCAAKETNLDEARKILLPAPADQRTPMKQILERLSGGDNRRIESAVAKLKDTPDYDSARLYADLYIGMIADAEGEPDKAKQFIRRAASTALTNYMADVARVYAATLR